jgi:hypothetical protein
MAEEELTAQKVISAASKSGIPRKGIFQACYTSQGIIRSIMNQRVPNGVREEVVVEFPDKSGLKVSHFVGDASGLGGTTLRLLK